MGTETRIVGPKFPFQLLSAVGMTEVLVTPPLNKKKKKIRKIKGWLLHYRCSLKGKNWRHFGFQTSRIRTFHRGEQVIASFSIFENVHAK